MGNHEQLQTSNEEAEDSQGPAEVASDGLATIITLQEAKGARPFEENNRCSGSRATVNDPEGEPANRGLHEFIIYDDAREPKALGSLDNLPPA